MLKKPLLVITSAKRQALIHLGCGISRIKASVRGLMVGHCHHTLHLSLCHLRLFYSALLLIVLSTFSVPGLDLGQQASLWLASAAEWRLVSKHQGCENVILLGIVGAWGMGSFVLLSRSPGPSLCVCGRHRQPHNQDEW